MCPHIFSFLVANTVCTEGSVKAVAIVTSNRLIWHRPKCCDWQLIPDELVLSSHCCHTIAAWKTGEANPGSLSLWHRVMSGSPSPPFSFYPCPAPSALNSSLKWGCIFARSNKLCFSLSWVEGLPLRTHISWPALLCLWLVSAHWSASYDR